MEITDKFIEPLPSATVLLIRDSAKGPEVLLVLRRKEAVFGSSYVFPGGVIDPVDHLAEHYLKKAEKASLLTARYLWNFLSGMISKHQLKLAA